MPPVLFSLVLVVFSFTTGEFVIVGILPDVAADLLVSIPDAGLLVTAYALGMIVGGPVVTALTARVARKPLMVGLVGVSLLGNAASAAAPNYAVLLVSRFVAGLVVATFFAVAIATAVSLAPAAKQASTVAKVALGMNLGMILGTPIGTSIGHNAGWRATFATIAGLTAVALVLVLVFVPVQPAVASSSVLGELRVFADRGVLLAIALTALGNVGVVTVFSYITPLLVDIGGFAAGTVPVLLLVYGVGAVVGNFLGGWLADRARMPALIGLLTALALDLLVFWLVGGMQVAAVILTFSTGVLAFAIIPGMQTQVVVAASAAPTLAVAVNASGFQLAAAFAGWFGGWIIGSGPGLRSLHLAGAVLTAASLAIAFLVVHRDRRPVAA
ncbi:MFS transporter [Saccharopolyspora indica]|uniref:MFS transporter n=1 Tax=Saccharopolyspora indica TaxID=1229659 RepID=UPI0022EA7590|nr:MFS transporter [Saccharopolyspora indica]MDA3648697.1 MFS transporter [Saccharopolyspora indica]